MLGVVVGGGDTVVVTVSRSGLISVMGVTKVIPGGRVGIRPGTWGLEGISWLTGTGMGRGWGAMGRLGGGFLGGFGGEIGGGGGRPNWGREIGRVGLLGMLITLMGTNSAPTGGPPRSAVSLMLPKGLSTLGKNSSCATA